MPTNYECAMMSNLAYTPEDSARLFESGWQWCHGTQETSFIIGEHGLAYALYRHDVNHEIVVAFRGTANNDNLASDFWMAWGYQPDTYPAARDAIEQFINSFAEHGWQDYTLTFTGHSLGGSLATMCAITFSRRAVVFDSASLADSFVIPEDYDRQQIRTFVTSPDAVNTLNPHIGETRRLMLRPIQHTSWQHATACIWGSVSRTAIILAALAYGARKYWLTDISDDRIEKATIGAGTLAAHILSRCFHYGITGQHTLYVNPLLSLGISLLGASPGMRVDYDWLFTRHHAMDLIENAMNPAEGAVVAPQIQSWPSFRQHWFINRPAYELKGFVPLLPSNRGLHTLLFSNESRVIEAQVDSMVGYRLMP